MKIPRVRLVKRSAVGATSEALVIFAYSGTKTVLDVQAARVLGATHTKKHADFFAAHNFKGQLKELLYLPSPSGNLHIVVGLGDAQKLTIESMRKAANAALAILEKVKAKKATLVVPENALVTESELMVAAAEGVILGSYEFDRYSTALQKKYSLVQMDLAVSSASAALQNSLTRTKVILDGVLLARDLENDSSDVVNPESFATQTAQRAKKLGITVKILDEKQLAREGFGLITAVGRGSRYKPRLVVLEYNGQPSSKERLALVGKGITFDSGGVNLKPSAGGMLEEMHMDMSGAAVVQSVLLTAARLKVKKNIVGIMPLAENAISGDAYKPGTVITAYGGKTVHILNTDAEGRLVLADGLAYVTKHYQPSSIIDFATLTGAALVALGEVCAAMISNNDLLALQLFESGQRTFERLWQLPLYDEYRDEVKGTIADLQNIGKSGGGRYAGTITAGAFLENFIAPKTPWAHIDIAGTSMISARHDYLTRGGTGFGIRLMIDFLQRNSDLT